MKKIAIALAGIIVFLIGFIAIIVNANKDNVGPNITVKAEGIKYSADCKDKVLIKGAKAVDKVDGDVSDTLEIVGRTVIKENETEIVEYVACDKSGNVSTKKMVFTMIDEENFQVSNYDDYEVDYDNLESSVQVADNKGYLAAGAKEKEDAISENNSDNVSDKTSKKEGIDKLESSKGTLDEEGATGEPTKNPERNETEEPTVEPTEKATKSPTKKPTKEPTKAPTKKPTKAPTKAPTKQPTNSRPTIVLKTNDITVRRGSSSTVYLNCIREIKDDKDSSEQLFRKVGMTRGLSLRVAGTYTQGLYCVDSDGNRSNVAVITVHVR